MRTATIFLVLLSVAISGCLGGSRSLQHRLRADASSTHCEPPSTLSEASGISFGQLSASERVLTAAQRLPSLSAHAWDMAEIIGLDDLLGQLFALDAVAHRESERMMVRRLQLRQQIADRISLASLEVLSFSAEVSCEETRTDHLADGLTEIRNNREEIGLLVAIVGDALIGIGAGALGLAAKSIAVEIVDIIGGAIAAGFGTAAIFAGGESDFRHPRNLLREVWEGPERSGLFPATVWRYLNWEPKDGTGSIRQRLIALWRQEGEYDETNSNAERQRLALFLGDGGTYTIEDLRDRAAMLHSLRADVNLMSQDLLLLLRELLTWESAHPTIISAP